jgi:hypothetical protein
MRRTHLIATLFGVFMAGGASTAQAFWPHQHYAPAYYPMPEYYYPPVPMHFHYPQPAPVINRSTTQQASVVRQGQTANGQPKSTSVSDTRTVQSSPAGKAKTNTVSATRTVQNPQTGQTRTTSVSASHSTQSSPDGTTKTTSISESRTVQGPVGSLPKAPMGMLLNLLKGGDLSFKTAMKHIPASDRDVSVTVTASRTTTTEKTPVAKSSPITTTTTTRTSTTTVEFGLLVMESAPGGFRGKGDLRWGDIVVAVGGTRVRTNVELGAVIERSTGPIDLVFFNGETKRLEKMVITPAHDTLGLVTVQAPIPN